MYKNILVPVDGSQLAECVVPHVEDLAKAYGSETVTFVQVLEPWIPWIKGDELKTEDSEFYARHEAASKSAAEKYLMNLSSKVNFGSAKVNTAVLLGRPAEQIAEYAGKTKTDAIVMSTHGRSGVTKWAMGSVADKLLHIAPVPVLVIRAPGCGAK
jgi:nucleotide-binding universal stress UspA family protein